MALSDYVHVARRFQRSIRIDSDLGDPRALEGFVCPQSSAEVLLSMARHVQETGQAAFTWTGPYGSGKSSLVVALGALLNGNEQLREEAANTVGNKVAQALWEALPPGGKGWRILPVVGRRGDPAAVIGEALVSRGFIPSEETSSWTDTRIVQVLIDLIEAESRSQDGLVVILDEMGKFLESASQRGTDIYLFQQLAEAASRSNGRLVIVGVLHQAFDEYAQRIARELRDEWSKVQGRFVDLAVNISGDEHLELLSRAIEVQGDIPDVLSVNAVAGVIRGNRSASADLSKYLKKCWPLHPVVSSLLGPISRRRFGQNQRSLFGFLSSAEPYGFQDFLRSAREDELYTPDRLWDYLRSNLESAILASPDGHRWSMAVEVIERCEAIGTEPLQVLLLKTISLIDLFRERSGLMATPELLEAAFANEIPQKVSQALENLIAWSHIIFRKHLGSYAIYAGSDFDIEGALTEALANLPDVNFHELRSLAGLQPILAKRHYHKTGALRWFDVDLIPLNDSLAAASAAPSPGGAIGTFFLAIPTANETTAYAHLVCHEAVLAAKGCVVIGLSGQAWHVLQLAKEFLAISRVREERPELTGDSVARREVLARIANLRTRLEADLQKMFDTADWFLRDQKPRRYSFAELNFLASTLADEMFAKSPHLPNELVNRVKPSSNAVAAQKALLKRMVQGEGELRLGIEGYPAEGGLCDSILLKSRLYRENAEHGWHFAAPELDNDPSYLAPAWTAAIELVSSISDRSINLSELYACWRAVPFGIKEGMLPILGVAFILGHKDQLAFYREGIFQARFTDLDVDYLAVDPTSIQIRWMELSETSRHILSGLAQVVQGQGGGEQLVGMEPIDVARGLVAIFDGLPQWAKRTNLLSKNATTVRDLFKQARDPNKFIFNDIPRLFFHDASDIAAIDEALLRIKDGIEELTVAYSDMLHRLRAVMMAELQVPNESTRSLADLRGRAKNIHQLTGDFRLNAFISRLMKFSGSEVDMEGIASLVVNKSPREWVDADLDRANLELAAISQQFIRAEAFARVKGRPDKRQAMAVVVGIGGRPTPISGEFEVTDTERADVEIVIRHVDTALKAADRSKRNIILAALAEISARYLDEEGSAQMLAEQFNQKESQS
jgi:hypothetical protein